MGGFDRFNRAAAVICEGRGEQLWILQRIVVAIEDASLAHSRMFAPTIVVANEAIRLAPGYERRLGLLIAAKTRLKLS